MIDIVSREQMVEFDQNTIKTKTPSLELMYKAALGVYNAFEYFSKKVYIVVGSGNNGGDGLALANIMIDNNIYPSVYLIKENLKNDALYYLEQLKNRGYENIFNITQCDYDCDVLVDTIFGTGFSRNVEQPIKDIINNINESRAYKISVDIASGLNSNNGIANCAVKADLTVAIQFFKYGHFLNDGKDYSKEFKVVDIGIEKMYECAKIIEDKDIVFKERKFNSSKFDYGASLIIGGSKNYVGALKLANMGVSALRVGGGLNTIASITSLESVLKSTIVENTYYALSEENGFIKFNKQQIDYIIKDKKAIATGMGLGSNYIENQKLIDHILNNFNGPVILDADGINTFKGQKELLKNKNVILTPHIKEFSRLSGVAEEDVLKDPVFYAAKLAKELNVTILLKGATSVITDGNQIYFVNNGTPALAKGGSGDTLSGVILGLLSQGYSKLESAYMGAYLCAKAANNAQKDYSVYGVLASDVAKEISKLI